MHKALIISGPTASGKTDLAYNISEHVPAVILNADSRHVFKELNIIAGKDLPEGATYIQSKTPVQSYFEHKNTELYLFDIIRAETEFSVNDYVKSVSSVIDNLSTDRLLIFVGGSNFYISALTKNIETLHIPPNKALRMKLEKVEIKDLQGMLESIDKNRLLKMNESDRKNPRRLIRALEVAKSGVNGTSSTKSVLNQYEVKHMGLTAPLDDIRRKIDARTDSRIAKGAFDEAEKLFSKYERLSTQVRSSNGYKQLFEYFKGEMSRDDAIKNWKYSEYHNAKKQLTWIHGDKNIEKYSINDKYFQENVLNEVLEFVHR